MTAVNILISSETILCVTDTVASDEHGVPAKLKKTKCRIFHAAGFAMAFRGCSVLGESIERKCVSFGDFDEAAWGLRWYIAGIPGDLFGDAGSGREGLDVFLMGYSNEKEKLMAFHIERSGPDVSDVFAEVLPLGFNLNPSLPDGVSARLPKNGDENLLKRLSIAQFRVNKDIFNKSSIGGVMHVTKIEPKSITQRILDVYPDYDDLTSRIDDPCWEEAGFFRKYT